MAELKEWLNRILEAPSEQEVFTILDEFRPLPWSDEERASMSKAYNAKLYQLNLAKRPVEAKQSKSGKNKSSSNISKQEAGNQRGESTSPPQEMDEDEI